MDTTAVLGLSALQLSHWEQRKLWFQGEMGSILLVLERSQLTVLGCGLSEVCNILIHSALHSLTEVLKQSLATNYGVKHLGHKSILLVISQALWDQLVLSKISQFILFFCESAMDGNK